MRITVKELLQRYGAGEWDFSGWKSSIGIQKKLLNTVQNLHR
ncbi:MULTISPECIES: hypothetical protein [Nostocales]|uniref:Uncharacterized protein n=2 Tax=Nostocales TaxID=1161 RepID=A0ABW8WEH0_9CYAN|nr:hypothetical protein [Tolypothrix bouteillei]